METGFASSRHVRTYWRHDDFLRLRVVAIELVDLPQQLSTANVRYENANLVQCNSLQARGHVSMNGQAKGRIFLPSSCESNEFGRSDTCSVGR